MTKVLIQGPIAPHWAADRLAELEGSHHTGANALFLGRVRADQLGDKAVEAIEYSAYERMARHIADAIQSEAREQFEVQEVRIFHAVGPVRVGEASLLVIASSAHRKAAFAALEYAVDELKKRFPAWKKELFSDGSHRWIGEPGSG